jgi:uncharacterized protein
MRRHPATAFVALAYGFSWLAWSFGGYFATASHANRTMLLLVGGWGPALAAIAVARSGRPAAGSAPRHTPRAALFAAAASVGLIVLAWRFTSGGRDAITGGPGAGRASLAGLPLLSALVATALLAFVISSIRSPDRGVRSLTSRLARWRVAPVYYGFALLAFPAFALAGTIPARALGETVPPATVAGHPPQTWIPLLLSSFLLSLLYWGGVGEEVGWRGFLLPQLQRRFSPLAAAMIVGVVWELWRLPLLLNGFYRGGPVLIVARLPLVILFSILFTWLYNRTGGSLLVVILLHGALGNHGVLVPATPYTLLSAVVVAAALVVMDRMYLRLPRAAARAAPAVPVGRALA